MELQTVILKLLQNEETITGGGKQKLEYKSKASPMSDDTQ